MGWESMIDGLAKHYPGQFHVPFTTFRDIFRKIEEKFIVKEWSQYMYTNWLGSLKKETKIKAILLPELDNEIATLDSINNYWVVVVFGQDQRARQYVYDCHVDSMKYLISYFIRNTSGDFFIVDKKYNWITYFKVDYNNKEVSLFKSGDTQTPFEKR